MTQVLVSPISQDLKNAIVGLPYIPWLPQSNEEPAYPLAGLPHPHNELDFRSVCNHGAAYPGYVVMLYGDRKHQIEQTTACRRTDFFRKRVRPWAGCQTQKILPQLVTPITEPVSA